MFVRRESFKEYIRLYPITTCLIAINIIMLVIMEIYGSSLDSYTLLKFGAMFTIPDFQPEWWRYITAIGLHAGWTHMLFNSFSLLIFAPPLERMLGKWRYVVCYIASGVAGNIISGLFQKDYVISVGASGAIYGIYAAYVYLAIFRKDIMDESSGKTIKIIIGIGIIHSLIVPNINLWAHLGGFIGGFVTIALMVYFVRRRYSKRNEREEPVGDES